MQSEDCTVIKCYKTNFHTLRLAGRGEPGADAGIAKREPVTNAIITTRHLNKQYPGSRGKAVDDLSFDIRISHSRP